MILIIGKSLYQARDFIYRAKLNNNCDIYGENIRLPYIMGQAPGVQVVLVGKPNLQEGVEEYLKSCKAHFAYLHWSPK